MQKNIEPTILWFTEWSSPFDVGANMVDQEESPSALADALEVLASTPIASPYDIDTSQFKTFDCDLDVAERMSFSECVAALGKRTLAEQKEVLGHPYLWERIQYALDAYRLNLYATSDDEQQVASAFLFMKQAIAIAAEDFQRALRVRGEFDAGVGLMPVEVDASWVRILNQQVAPWLKDFTVSLRILDGHSVYEVLETGLHFMRLVQGYSCLDDYTCFFNQLCDAFCDSLLQDMTGRNHHPLGVVQYSDKVKTLWQHYWSVPSAVQYTYHYLDGKQCELTERGNEVLTFPWSEAENAIPLDVYAKCVCLLVSNSQRNAWGALYALASDDAFPAYGENVLMDTFLAQAILSSWFHTSEADRMRLLEVRYMQHGNGKPLLEELATGAWSSSYSANLWLSVIKAVRKTYPVWKLDEEIRYHLRAVCGCDQDRHNVELWDQTLNVMTAPLDDAGVQQQAISCFSRLLQYPCSHADKANVFMDLHPACWRWIFFERRNGWKHALSLFLQRVLDDQGMNAWRELIAKQCLQNEQACRSDYMLLWAFVTQYLCSNDLEKVCEITGEMFDQVDTLACGYDKSRCYLSLGYVVLFFLKAPCVYELLERESFEHALTMGMDRGRSFFSRIAVNYIVEQQDVSLFQRPRMMQMMRHVLHTDHCLREVADHYKWLYKQLFVMIVCLYSHGLKDVACRMQTALVALDKVDAQGLHLSKLSENIREKRLAPLVQSLMVFAQRVFGRGVSEHQLQLLMMLDRITSLTIHQGHHQLQSQQAVHPSPVATTPRCDSGGVSLFTPKTAHEKRKKTANSFGGHASSALLVSTWTHTAGASGLGATMTTTTGEPRELSLSKHGVFTRSEGKRKRMPEA